MVRFKNRWLLVEFLPATGLTSSEDLATSQKQIWAALKQSVLTNFGDAGWGTVALSLTVKYYSPTTHLAIIRVAREHHKIAWGALTLLTSLDGQKCIPHVVHLSGTIRHAQLAAIEHNRVVVARLRAKAKTPVGYTYSYEQFLEQSAREIEAMQD